MHKQLFVLLIFSLFSHSTSAQFQHRHGRDERHDEDHRVFQFLLENHKLIERNVQVLENGVKTLTESQHPEVAQKIQEHAKWMQHRIEHQQPIRRRDPLFNELFRHTKKIQMKRENTKHGVRVVETSTDPQVVRLIQAHAKAVSLFVEKGFAEAMKNHAVPDSSEVSGHEYITPVVKEFGKVVKLPKAAHQPRNDSQIVVDLTNQGAPEKLSPAIEKVARYVNIYGGAGDRSTEVSITVVLHGDATFCVLNDEAYEQQFGVNRNPNLECLRALHSAGVKFMVCGQSLIGKDQSPKDVVVFADVAVSALTTLVNLQADGYAYIPLLK